MTRVLIGFRSVTYVVHSRLFLTISTIRALLAGSKRMYLPSTVNSPKDVVAIATGHSVTTVVLVSVLRSLDVVSLVRVVRHPSSTSVPFHVVVVVSVRVVSCAKTSPAKSGTSIITNFMGPPINGRLTRIRRPAGTPPASALYLQLVDQNSRELKVMSVWPRRVAIPLVLAK